MGKHVLAWRRLTDENVERGPCDGSGIQGSEQGIFIHRSATRSIDQKGMRLHGLKL